MLMLDIYVLCLYSIKIRALQYICPFVVLPRSVSFFIIKKKRLIETMFGTPILSLLQMALSGKLHFTGVK
jgi:hypothetical protein